jgi:TRAP-type mannitol/chloroaromatic compound transport system permease small subunit
MGAPPLQEHERVVEAVVAAEHGSVALVLPETRLSRSLDRLIDGIGKVVSWLWVVLIAIILVNVVMRYVLNLGLIVFEELQWHIYAVGFMIGLSFGVVGDRHVRIDVLADRFAPRARAWIELLGLLLFLIPFALLIAWDAIPFVTSSWAASEVSIAPGGLPARWALKSVIIVALVMLAIAAFSRLTRVSSFLFGVPRPLGGPPRPGA